MLPRHDNNTTCASVPRPVRPRVRRDAPDRRQHPEPVALQAHPPASLTRSVAILAYKFFFFFGRLARRRPFHPMNDHYTYTPSVRQGTPRPPPRTGNPASKRFCRSRAPRPDGAQLLGCGPLFYFILFPFFV
jgi:hypothetical protein